MHNEYPENTVKSLFKLGRTINIKKGSQVLGPGKPPEGVYYIVAGFVRFYSITEQGDENVLVILGPGEIFPFVYAYLGVQSETFADAITDSKIQCIPRDRYTDFSKSNPKGGYALAWQMAKQTRVFNGRLENLEYKRASERVAFRLLFLAERFGTRSGSDIYIEVPITQGLLAQTINLTRESVSREISKLERKGVISRRGLHIVLKDTDYLKKQLNRLGYLEYGELI